MQAHHRNTWRKQRSPSQTSARSKKTPTSIASIGMLSTNLTCKKHGKYDIWPWPSKLIGLSFINKKTYNQISQPWKTRKKTVFAMGLIFSTPQPMVAWCWLFFLQERMVVRELVQRSPATHQFIQFVGGFEFVGYSYSGGFNPLGKKNIRHFGSVPQGFGVTKFQNGGTALIPAYEGRRRQGIQKSSGPF